MHIRDLVLSFVVMLLLVSTVIPVLSGDLEDDSKSGSIAPFEEFYEPDEKTERQIDEDTQMLIFSYTYMMDHEIVPENLLMFLNGTCSSYQHYTMTVNRPDDENITLIDQERNQNGYIDEITDIRRRMSIRENIYENMVDILSREEEDWTDPGLDDMADPTKILFGEVDEDVLVDPDPLKGEYEIIVKISGEDIEMNFGEDETKLSILSKPASKPRNLEVEYKDDEVELEWDEPEEKGGSEIMHYNIYRGTTIHGYDYLGNVSADQTEYVDEFEGETLHQEVKDGDILYYRVAAINRGDHYYLLDTPHKKSHFLRPESISLEERIHLPYEETEMSDMSYKWVMDYPNLSEENFEDRVNMDSVNIDKMEGGDVFLYDLNRSGEEDGKIVFEYEGGFYSKGEIDMVLEDGDVASNLNINMSESWCDFSGKIWAEEIPDTGYEGLTIVKQTVQSEGEVSANLDNRFKFTLEGDENYWEVSQNVDIEWGIDFTLDYEGNNSWIVSDKEETTLMTSREGPPEFSYSGSINAEGRLSKQSNHLDDEEETESEISKDISGTERLVGSSSAQGSRGTFSPLVGAGNIGYYLTLDQNFDASMGDLQFGQDPFYLAFSTNCQRDEFSTEKLYRYQYMDPMALPGIGSFLGTGLKRANLINNQQHLRGIIQQMVRRRKREMEDEPEEGWDEWEEEVKEETLETIILETPWGIHQYNGIYSWDLFTYGALVIEPFGYFGSEPLSEEEIEDYNEDREEFFENQIPEDESEVDDDEESTPGYTFVVLVVGIFLSVIIKKGSKK